MSSIYITVYWLSMFLKYINIISYLSPEFFKIYMHCLLINSLLIGFGFQCMSPWMISIFLSPACWGRDFYLYIQYTYIKAYILSMVPCNFSYNNFKTVFVFLPSHSPLGCSLRSGHNCFHLPITPSSSLIVHPHLLVRATSERWVPQLVATSGSY